MHGFKLGTHSPCSVTASPILLIFIHILCGMLTSQQSLNSKCLNEFNTTLIPYLAIFIAFIFWRTGNYTQDLFISEENAALYKEFMNQDNLGEVEVDDA